MNYAKLVGQVIRLHREMNGIEQRTMAKAMGMSASGWSRVETGDTTITVAQLRKAAQVLGMEPWMLVQQADLIGGTMKIMIRDGKKMMVMRPSDPEKAVKIALEAQKANDADRFLNLPEEVGDYTFVGYLSAEGRQILDENGAVVGDVQKGDSFVTRRSIDV